MSDPNEMPDAQDAPPSRPNEPSKPGDGNRAESAADDKAAPLPTSPTTDDQDTGTTGS